MNPKPRVDEGTGVRTDGSLHSAAEERAGARVVGIVRGREVHADAIVTLDAVELVLEWEPTTDGQAAPWRLRFDGLDGISHTANSLTVYLESHDVLELSGDDMLRTLAARLIDRACAMPELTRGLRSLGSLRGFPGAAHDVWFAPLIAARSRVEGVSDPQRQLALLDAASLSAAMERAIQELAALTAPGDLAQQRAIEAALEEESHDMRVALTRLALAADTLRGAASDTLLIDWRQWVAALGAVFSTADDAWGRCSTQL